MSILTFSLQRFVGRGDRFFDLLEASAGEARRAAQSLVELIEAPEGQDAFESLGQIRRADKRIHNELSALLCSTFITPMDREDIDAISSALSRIPKVIKKFGERLLMLRRQIDVRLFDRQAKLLERSTETLSEMVHQLRHHPHLDRIQEANDRLHEFEAEADKLILERFAELYSGQFEALQMIVLRDLYELLEKVIDRCRDAGNAIFQVVLKHS